jgi:hypothetical protein
MSMMMIAMMFAGMRTNLMSSSQLQTCVFDDTEMRVYECRGM